MGFGACDAAARPSTAAASALALYEVALDAGRSPGLGKPEAALDAAHVAAPEQNGERAPDEARLDSGRLSLPHHETFGVLRFMEQIKHVFQAHEGLGLHFQEADPALIVIHPAHDRLFDFRGLELVGEPQLQPQTRPAREGRCAFNPTPSQGEIQNSLLHRPRARSHGPLHRHTCTNSLGDHIHSFFGRKPRRGVTIAAGHLQPYQQEVRRQDLNAFGQRGLFF